VGGLGARRSQRGGRSCPAPESRRAGGAGGRREADRRSRPIRGPARDVRGGVAGSHPDPRSGRRGADGRRQLAARRSRRRQHREGRRARRAAVPPCRRRGRGPGAGRGERAGRRRAPERDAGSPRSCRCPREPRRGRRRGGLAPPPGRRILQPRPAAGGADRAARSTSGARVRRGSGGRAGRPQPDDATRRRGLRPRLGLAAQLRGPPPGERPTPGDGVGCPRHRAAARSPPRLCSVRRSARRSHRARGRPPGADAAGRPAVRPPDDGAAHLVGGPRRRRQRAFGRSRVPPAGAGRLAVARPPRARGGGRAPRARRRRPPLGGGPGAPPCLGLAPHPDTAAGALVPRRGRGGPLRLAPGGGREGARRRGCSRGTPRHGGAARDERAPRT
jgi:hypothetical protein